MVRGGEIKVVVLIFFKFKKQVTFFRHKKSKAVIALPFEKPFWFWGWCVKEGVISKICEPVKVRCVRVVVCGKCVLCF
jgi:hypothetical protein